MAKPLALCISFHVEDPSPIDANQTRFCVDVVFLNIAPTEVAETLCVDVADNANKATIKSAINAAVQAKVVEISTSYGNPKTIGTNRILSLADICGG